MKKAFQIFCRVIVLLVAAVLVYGCGKSEEKKAEAPAAGTEAVTQEAAPVVQEPATESQEMMDSAATEGQETMEEATPTPEPAVEQPEGMAGDHGADAFFAM